MLKNISRTLRSFIAAAIRKKNFRAFALSVSTFMLAIVLVATTTNFESARAVTIRSTTGTDACTVNVGTAGAATIQRNGDYCIVTVTANTSVTIPNYVSSMGVIAVGGGGGGGADGGSGGGGGEVRWSTAQNVTAGSTITISIGNGGNGGSWGSSTAGSNGSATTISGGGVSYTANGGTGGGGWTTTTGGAGGTAGSGGTNSAQGARGGGGPGDCPGTYVWTRGAAGSNGTSFSAGQFGAVGPAFAGGGGGGAAGQMYNSGSAVLGVNGGVGGGGRGANYKLALDDVTAIDGASAGHSALANTGGGGGGGTACNARGDMGLGYDGVSQRTAGGNGGSGTAVLSFIESKLSMAQQLDGCATNTTEVCLQSAKVQLQDTAGSNINTSGVSVILTASGGTLNGSTTISTDATGLATFSNIYITGSTAGATVTLTFEAVGYRNVQQSLIMKMVPETLDVVSGSTDVAGSFIGTTGTWMATASTSSVSVTSLANQLSNRDVLLRAYSASTTSLGNVTLASNAVLASNASATRTLTVKASRNVILNSGGQLGSSGQALNIIVWSDSDGVNNGMVWVGGSASTNTLLTAGGHVAIGGGSSSTTWKSLTIPAGYASGLSANTGSWWGVEFGTNTAITGSKLISTSGGDVRAYGNSSASASSSALYGVAWESGSISTGAGSVEFNGTTTGSPSVATADNWGVGIGANHGSTVDVPVLSSSGTVNINGTVGTAGTANYWSVAIGYSDLSSGSGGINVGGALRAIAWEGNTFRGPLTLTSNDGTQLSGSNTFTDSATIVASAGGAYIAGSQTFSTSAKGLTVKTSADITTAASTSISTQSGDVVFWANTDKVAGTSNPGRIGLGTSNTITTRGGKIWLAGGLDDGGTDATIASAKGAWSSLAVGDGLPDGYATGQNAAGQYSGVSLNTGVQLSSGGGDIFVAGMEATVGSGTTTDNVYIGSGLIDSGTGRIAIWGKSAAAYNNSYGVLLHQQTDNTAATTIYSANRTAQAITIYGDSSVSTYPNSWGVVAQNYSPNVAANWGYNSVRIISAGLKDSADLANKPGGGVNITGLGSTATTTGGGHGIVWQWADIISKDGDITMTGSDNNAVGGNSSAGIYFGLNNGSVQSRFGAFNSTVSDKTYTSLAGVTTDFSSSTSDITLNATKFVFYEFSGGTGYWFNTSGDITLQSYGDTFTYDQTTTHWQFARISIAGNPRNVTIGKPTDASFYRWYYSIAATGSIKFYAGRIEMRNGSAPTTYSTTLGASGTTSRNIGFLLKTRERLWLQTSVNVTTSGSDVVMWSDSDNDETGAQYYEGSNVFTTNGGNITMAGGLDTGANASFAELTGRTAGDGVPDGYAVGVASWGNQAGVEMHGGFQLLSGGGNIHIAGRGSAVSGDSDMGAAFGSGLIYSSTGTISIFGRGPASCATGWHRGIFTGYDGTTSIISDKVGAGAIKFYGNTAACDSGWSVYANAIQGYNYRTYVATPLGGDIDVYGIQGNASYYTGDWSAATAQESDIVCLNYWHVVTQNGDIKLEAETATTARDRWALRFATRSNAASYLGANPAALSTGFTAYPTIGVFSNSGDITMTADSIVAYSTTIATTGNLTLEPFAASFDKYTYFSSTWGVLLPSTYNNIRIGKAGTSGANQNSGGFDVSALNARGDIEIYGGDMLLLGNVTTSATSGKGVLVKSTGRIDFADGTSGARRQISVTGANSTAPVAIWSNADATGGGAIQIGNYTDVKTTGADITIGGSASAADTTPTGYAESVASDYCNGIELGVSNVATDSVNIASNGGDITIRGKQNYNAASCVGIKAWSGTTIDSGAGAIIIDGTVVNATSANNGHGIELNWSGGYLTKIFSAATSGTAITITGTSNGTSTNARGIAVWSGSGTATHQTQIKATNGADISLFGRGASGSGSNAITLNAVDLYATGGDVTLDGGSQEIYIGESTAGGSYIGGPASGSNSGDITIKADKITFGATASTSNFQNASNLFLISNAASFNAASVFGAGMNVSNIGYLQIGKATNTADVTVNGTNSVAGDIDITGGAISIGGNQTATTGGDITIIGTGGYSGTGALNAAGNISVTANGSTTTGAFTSAGSGGINFLATGSDINVGGDFTANTSTTAPILLKAVRGVFVLTGADLVTAGGNVTLWARYNSSNASNDSGRIQLQNTTSITTNGGAITLAGSSSTDGTTGLPNGYALSNDATKAGVGFGLSDGTSLANNILLSGGGAIQIRGKSIVDGPWGIGAWKGLKIDSGTGRILLDGWATGTKDGVQIDGSSTIKSLITSAAAANAQTPAISITGDSDSTSTADTHQRGIWLGATGGVTISATGGGDVLLTATNSAVHATDPGALYIQGADILASTGYVKLDGGTSGVVTSISGGTTNLGALSGGSATGAVTIVGDKINSAGTTTIKTAGAVVEESSSDSFAGAFSASTLNVTAGAASLRIGKTTNTSNVTLSAGTVSTLGDIEITGAAITNAASLTTTSTGNIVITASGAYSGAGALDAKGKVVVSSLSFNGTGAITSAGALGIAVTATGGSISIGANLEAKTSTTAPVTLKASGDLSVTASKSITTAGGNAILWSRYLAATGSSTVGSITLNNSTTITTNGGKIILAGTSAVDGDGLPTGYAYNTATSAAGVRLGTSDIATDTNVKLTSGGGEIRLVGQHVGSAVNSWGVILRGGATINSGSGAISIDAKSDSNTGNALDIEPSAANNVKILSAATSGTAISLSGASTNPTAGSGRGIYIGGTGFTLNASGGGDVSLVASQTTTSSANPGALLIGAGADILASGGSLTVNAGAKGMHWTGTVNLGSLSSATTAAASDVTVIGDALNGTPTVYTRTTGDVVFESSSANFASTFSTTSLTLAGPPSSLRIGKAGNTSAVTISAGTINVAGPVTINGAAVTVSGTITTTTAGGDISIPASGVLSITTGMTASGSIAVTGTTVTTSANWSASGNDGVKATATAGAVTIGGTTAVTTSTSGPVIFKATTNVITGDSDTIVTAGGDVVLWARSGSAENVASQTGEGFVKIGNSSSITTNGGDIIIAGSSSTDSATGYPNGHTFTNASGIYGLYMGTATTGAPVNLTTTDSDSSTTDGAIRIYAQSGSSAAHGVFLKNNGTLTTWNSGTGRQDIHVLSANAVATTGYVFECSGPFTVKSAAVADAIPAIRFTVQQTNSASTIRPMMQNDVDTKFIANGGGDLEMNITTVSTSNKIAFGNGYRLYFLATSGEIRGNFGGGLGLGLANAAKPMVIGSDLSSEVPSSSSNITIGIETFVDSSADSSAIVRTSGSVKIQPPGAVGTYPGSQSFSAAQTFDSTWLFTGISGVNGGNIGGITIGQTGSPTASSQNDSNVTLSTANTVAGDLTIYGATVALNSNQTTTGSGRIRIRANTTISTGASVSLVTAGGQISLWSDYNLSGGGAIYIGATNTMNSNGGAIALAGGADDGASTVESGRTAGDWLPDGYAAGNSSNLMGVSIGQKTSISSGSGNVFIAGKGHATSSQNANGIQFSTGFQLSATSGTIHIYGVSNGTGTADGWGEGIRISGTSSDGLVATRIVNSSTAADAIIISGDASATTQNRSAGIYANSWYNLTGGGLNTVIANTSSGTVTISGRGAQNISTSTADNIGSGLDLQGISILAKSGSIVVNADTSAASSGTNAFGLTSNYVYAGTQKPNATHFGAGPAGTTINSVDMSSSSANITWNVDSFSAPNSSSTSTNVKSTGLFVIQPASASTAIQSFDKALTISTLTVTGITGLTIGQIGIPSATSQNTADVTISRAIDVAGPISVYGGNVTISAAQTVTASGSDVLLKATGYVSQNNGAITTQGGDVTLWSNAADANGSSNYVYSGSITTNDGDLTIGGGADLASGYATGNVYGVAMVSSRTVSTGAGSITVRGRLAVGQASGSSAVAVNSAISTTSGSITILGHVPSVRVQTTYVDYGVKVASTTIATDSGAISITGNSEESVYQWRTALSVDASTISSNSGDITLNGAASNATSNTDFSITGSSSINSGSGALLLSGSANALQSSINTATLSSTNSVTIRTQKPTFTSVSLSGTGAKVLESVGDAFGQTITTSAITFAPDSSSVRVGKTTNTATVTVGLAISAAGPIEINGGAVNVNTALTSTAAGNIAATAIAGNVSVSANITNSTASYPIVLKASGSVIVSPGVSGTPRTLQTNAGPITLWSNSDASGTGAVSLSNFVKLASTGGAITLAGSANNTETSPTGYARAEGSMLGGIELGTSEVANNVEILSAGGDITIRGYSNLNSSLNYGIRGFQGLNINSGSGAIAMEGQTDGITGSNLGQSIELSIGASAVAPTTITSTKTNGDAITMTGTSINGSATINAGVVFWAGSASVRTTLTASGAGGNIVITGTTTSANEPYGLVFENTDLLAKGSITLDSGSKKLGLALDSAHGAAVIGGATSGYNTGGVTMRTGFLNAANGTNVIRSSGNVVVEPPASDSSFAETQTWPASRISLIDVADLRIGKSGNAAAISVAQPISVAGDIEVFGSAITTTAAVGSTGGNVDLTGDQISIGAAVSTASSSSGIVTIAPATASKNIDLGGADSASLLALTNAELGFITAGTLRIGALGGSNSGNIGVSAAISASNYSTLALRTSGAVSGSGSVITDNLGVAAGGNISLTGQNNVTTLAMTSSGTTPTVAYTEATGETYSNGTVDGITGIFGAASQYAVTNVPTVGYVGSAFNPAPTVTLKDVYGNTISAQNSTTNTVEASTSSAGFSLGGTTSITQAGGVFTFNNLKVTAGTGSIVVNFENSAILSQASVDTASITIQAGDPDHLIVKVAAAGGKAGLAFTTQPQVEIQTSGNAVVTVNGLTLAVSASLTGGSGSLVGTTTVNAVNGVATFTDLGIGGLVSGTYEITFTATYSTNPAMTVAQSAITISYGTASKLSLSTPASGFVNRSNFTVQPAVTVQDAYDNTVTNYATAIAVGMTGGSTLTGTASATPNSGVATFSGLGAYGLISNTNVLTYTSGALTSATQSFNLTHGPAYQLAITTQASGATNGSVFTVQPVVEIQDRDGNRVTTGTQSTQDVVVSASATTLAGTATKPAIAGVATFDDLKLTGTAGTITLTYTITSPATKTKTQTIELVAGAPTQLIVYGAGLSCPSRLLCTNSPTVWIADASGNRTTSTATVTVTVKSGPGSVFSGGTKVATAGAASFSLRLQGTAANNYVLEYSTTNPDLTATQSNVSVTVGTVTKVYLARPAAGFNSGVNFTTRPLVYLTDEDNNRSEYTSQTMRMSVSAGVNGGTATITDTTCGTFGAGAVDCAGYFVALTGTADTYTITYSSAPYTAATQTVTLLPGVASKVVVTTGIAGFVNRTDFTTQPVAKIQDASGNTVTSSNADITVSISSGNLTGTRTLAAVNGVADWSTAATPLGKNGTIGAKTLTFASNGLTSDTTQQFTLTHGVATKIAITRSILSGAVVNDQAFAAQPRIAIQDQDSNVVTTGADATRSVTVSMSSGLSGTATLDAIGGTATFSGLKYTGLIGTYTITYSSGAFTALTEDITVGYGTATKVGFGTQAAGAVNGVAFTTQPTVEIQDVSGNKVSSSTASITASTSAGATLGGTVTSNATAGSLTFSALKLTGASGDYTLTYSSNGLTSLVQNITNAHGAATQISITGSSSSVNDQALALQPVVTVKDASGNTVTGSSASITLSATGANIGGTVTMNAVNGVANFDGKGVKLTGLVGAKTITATSTPGSFTADLAVTLTYGTATKLGVSAATVSATNRVAFGTQPTITVQDVSGNTVDNATNGITASVTSANSADVTLGGTTSSAATSGSFAFTNLVLSGKAATYTITYEAAGLTSTTQTATLVAGAVARMSLVTPAAGAVNDVAFTTQPSVKLLDADNNQTLSTATVSISVSAGASSGTAVIGGTYSLAASAGTATFTNVKLTGASDTYVLTYASAGLPDVTQNISVGAGAATKLVLIQSALGASSRIAFATQPIVEIQDASGNRVPGTTDTITVSSSGATLGGDYTMAAVNGTASFSTNANGLKLSGTIGTYTLTYAATGLTSATQPITLSFGTPSQLIVQTAAANAQAGIAFGTQPVIRVADADSNTITSGAGSDLNIRAASSDGTLSGTTTVQATGGVATFTNLKLSNAVGTYNLSYTATDTGYTNLTTADTVLLAAGTAVKLGMNREPSSGGATGSVFATQPKVAVLDAFDNIVLTDSGRTITASYANANGGTLSGSPNLTATTTNGVATFSGLKFVGTPGVNYSIHFGVASDTLTAVDSANFSLTHAAASQIVFIQQPIGGNATRTPLTTQPIVEIQDQYGNRVTTGADSTRVVTVNIHSDGGTGYGDLSTGQQTATAINGRATFTNVILSDVAVATDYTLDFTASLGGTLTTSAASSAFQIIHGAAHHIAITRSASGAAAGITMTTQPTIQIQDIENHVVLAGNGSNAQVRVTSSNGLTLSGTTTVTASNGVARFTDLSGAGLKGTYTLTFEALNLGFSTVDQSLALTFGAADRLAIGTQPAGGNASGDNLATQPVIRVMDAYGNRVEDSTATVIVSVATGDGQGTLTGASKNAVAGTATFTALNLIATPLTNYTLSFDSTNLTSVTSNAIQVTHAAASQLVWVTQPIGGNATGDDLAGQPVLQLKDRFGNLVTSDSTSVITASVASGAGATLSNATATANGGVVSFAHLQMVATPGTSYKLKFTTAAITSADSDAITVTNNVATQIVVSRAAAGARAGVAFTTQPKITIKDAYGNVVTTNSGSGATITASISTGGAPVGSASVAATQGVATFADLGIAGQSATYTITYSMTSPAALSTSESIAVSYGDAAALSIATQPVGGKTGDNLSTQPVVHVVDAYGNVVANSSAAVTASMLNARSGDVLNGATATAVNGVATFTTLNIVTLPGTSALVFSSGALTQTNSANFTITHADASQLVITGQPLGGNATGDRLAGQPAIEIRDRFNNLATSSTASVTASIASGSGANLSSGQTSVAAIGGVATFTNVRLIGTPLANYTIAFASGSLASATSAAVSVTNNTAYQ
ncbi:MAG: hypothetical protein RLZZ340_4, partial [Actinomycetota bacterium]